MFFTDFARAYFYELSFLSIYHKDLISQILGKVRQYIVKHDLLFHKSKATQLFLQKSKIMKERND